MSLPDTSDPGNFLFRIGTIFSSKYSVCHGEISLTLEVLHGLLRALVELAYLNTINLINHLK